MSDIKVVVNGALGHMGQEVIAAVGGETGLKLVGAVDVSNPGRKVGAEGSEVAVSTDLNQLLQDTPVDVVVDFTNPMVVMAGIETTLKNKVRPVVGTTGIVEADLKQVGEWVKTAGVGCFIAPNFAIGAILMMTLAARAARYMDSVEIIELHHDQKIDAPSGTAIKTAEMLASHLAVQKNIADKKSIEKIPGTRGGTHKGISIHSVRLPGLVAHQEVLLGSTGQALTIRHDSFSRKSFMPGVIMAIRRIMTEDTLIYGLENILDL